MRAHLYGVTRVTVGIAAIAFLAVLAVSAFAFSRALASAPELSCGATAKSAIEAAEKNLSTPQPPPDPLRALRCLLQAVKQIEASQAIVIQAGSFNALDYDG